MNPERVKRLTVGLVEVEELVLPISTVFFGRVETALYGYV